MQAVKAIISGPHYVSSLSTALPCQWSLLFQPRQPLLFSSHSSVFLCPFPHLKTSHLFFQDLFQILYLPWSLPWQLWPTKSILISDGPQQLSMALRRGDIWGQEPYLILTVCKANLAHHPLPPSPSLHTVWPSRGFRTKQDVCNLPVRAAWSGPWLIMLTWFCSGPGALCMFSLGSAWVLSLHVWRQDYFWWKASMHPWGFVVCGVQGFMTCNESVLGSEH